jgi:hypothetical protein
MPKKRLPKSVRDLLVEAADALDEEAENYRDGDEYQPRAHRFFKLAKRCRDAAKAVI